MAKLLRNRFSSWELSEEEELRGSILTEAQKYVMQNLLAKAAIDQQSLKPDPEKMDIFIQQEAYYKGQIELLEYLLEQSEYAETAILAVTSDAAADNTAAKQPAHVMSVFSSK